MPIVNFAVPKQLDKQINQTIKKEGFASKAEFFRLAAMNYLHTSKMNSETENERFDRLTKSISKLVKKQYRGKKLPSAAEQLADL